MSPRTEVTGVELVRRAWEGDREAFADLYRLHHRRVHGRLRMILDDAHEAEDAAQEVFIKLFEGFAELKSGGLHLTAWMDTVAANHARDHLRKHGRVRATDPLEVADLHDAAARDTRGTKPERAVPDDYVVFIRRLSPLQKSVIFLRFIIGMSPQETAEALGTTPGTVRQTQMRALRVLQGTIGREREVELGPCERAAARRLPWRSAGLARPGFGIARM